MTLKQDLKDSISTVWWTSVAVVCVGGFGAGVAVVMRPVAIFGEETRTQVYETSRSYQQAAQNNIARLCREMRVGDADHANAAYIAAMNPTVMRELLSRMERAEAEAARMREALVRADGFITNGISFGFIRMPNPGTPDPAHDTLGIIRAALDAAP